MPFTNFTDKVNSLHDVNNDAKLHTELKKFFEDPNNTRLMWADSGKNVSREHATNVALELKNLDENKQSLLKKAVSEIMKNLTAKINGEVVSCAEILANDWNWASKQNIPELRQAAALVSLHYMLTNQKPLLYGSEAQEYAQQFCDPDFVPTPANGTDKPTNGTDKPTNGTDKPANGTDKPANGTDKPTNGTDKPANGTDKPANGTDKPTNGTDKPTNGTDKPTNGTDKPTNGTDKPANGTDKPTNGTDKPTNGTDKPANGTESSTIDPISETTPDNTNTTEAMDGVPSVITSGIDRVDNKERKDYLTEYVDKELNQVVNTHFAKDELGNNKTNENALIIGFLNQAFSKDALMKEKGEQAEDKAGLLQDKSYEQSVAYYQALLTELKNNPRMDGRKLVIPESATFDGQKVTLVYPDKVSGGLFKANKKIEGKEKDRYMKALTKLSDNTNFLIDNTKDKVYTLGLNKVDTNLPVEGEKKTTGQQNIDLAVTTEYYTAIQIEHNATNTKLSELNRQYKESLGIIQKTTSDIVAENKKLNDAKLKPEDKIEAQVNLVSLNQKLLEEELKLLTTGSLISTLAGEGTPGIQSKDQIVSRMDKIKSDIKLNAEKMNAWITENEEFLKKLNNTKITSQIKTIKLASTEQYVQSQEIIVDSLKNVMNESNALFAKINKPYQESDKLLKTYEAQKKYWQDQLQALNPADPRFKTLKTQYETTLKTLDDNIKVEKDKQFALLKEFTDASAKASTDQEKTLRSALKNGERLYMVQKESSEELKKLAQSGERSSTLSNKESSISTDIVEQTKNNQSIIDKKGEQIQKESTEYSTKLATLQTDIDRKEQEVKTELEKAANNQPYDLEKVTKNQLELLTHYQEKQEFLDKYNDTYYKDQQNYQRDFKNKLIATTAHKEHTKQNVSRLEAQITEVDKDIATKRKLVMDVEAQITELVTTSTTDPTYQEYVNSEIARLTALMNTTILELTADETLIDPNNRRKTLENFKNCDMEYTVAGLYAVRNVLQLSYLDEKDQAIKREQAEKFEQSRIDYIGTNAQTAIMKEKLAFYGEYNTTLLTQIAGYEKSIADNTTAITAKRAELEIIAGDTEKEKLLNADIAKLLAENESLTKLKDDISSRQVKLQQALDAAKGQYATMVTNNENAKKVMNANESTLVNNKTELYTDQSSTLYDAGKLDEERMKYKPYKVGEVSSEVKTEEVKEVVKLTEKDVVLTSADNKYLDLVKEYRSNKGEIISDPLPIFNSIEEGRGKFGILAITKDSYMIGKFPDDGSIPNNNVLTITNSEIARYIGIANKNKEMADGKIVEKPVVYNRVNGELIRE